MKIGCFALVEPFTTMPRQFQAIREMGIDYADLTDNHNGATLGTEFGFAASVSLQSHPDDVRAMLGDTGITLTAVCAHANLLDPPGPHAYGTAQVIDAIKLAHFLGIKQVITTEGDPKTAFGESLSRDEALFAITERLYHPVRWAATLGIELLLEPHGRVTDDVDALAAVLDRLDKVAGPDVVGVNLDTGNAWLGGADPMDYITRLGDRIQHVHWKDMPAAMEAQRGKMFGCGMATIALGEGVVGIEPIVAALKASGFDGPTTLEIAGKEAVMTSAQRLRDWWGPGS